MIIDKWSWADYLYLCTFFDPQGGEGGRGEETMNQVIDARTCI